MYFIADTDKEKEDWINAIGRAIVKHSRRFVGGGDAGEIGSGTGGRAVLRCATALPSFLPETNVAFVPVRNSSPTALASDRMLHSLLENDRPDYTNT
jgi:hypothetical protein